MRIVSLLPSATEIICFLGLEDQLVGVTHECDYPSGVKMLPKVTNTLIPTSATSVEIDGLVRERLTKRTALYTLNVGALQELRPDLIVTQTLCDVCAVDEAEVKSAACQLPGSPKIINLEPETLPEMFDAIRQVAEAAGPKGAGPNGAGPEGAGIRAKAEELIEGLLERVRKVTEISGHSQQLPRVALLEWLDPPFSSGHWNPELVRLAGGMEVLGTEGSRSRTLSWREVIVSQPDVILISCCGFTVDRTLEDVPGLDSIEGWKELRAVREGRVYVTDGSQYFSRPGPRLVDSLEIIAHILHPASIPLPDGAPLNEISSLRPSF